jgi:Domain of unknown function (DUF4397)
VKRAVTRLLAAAAVLAALLAVAPAGADAAAPGQAMIRIAHFSPDAAYVDVYVVSLNRNQLFPNVFYKNVSAYWKVNAGPFTYEVRAAGAAPTSAPAIKLTGNLQAGRAYTVATVGPRTDLRAVLLDDDMTPTAIGRARVRFIAATVGLPAVDVAVDGQVLSKKLSFAAPSAYRPLPTGRLRVEARKPGGGKVLFRDDLRVRAGTVSSAVLIGGAGQPREVFAFADATGVGTMPAGGIRTGAGGAARAGAQGPGRPLAVAGLIALTAAAAWTTLAGQRRAS